MRGVECVRCRGAFSVPCMGEHSTTCPRCVRSLAQPEAEVPTYRWLLRTGVLFLLAAGAWWIDS